MSVDDLLLLSIAAYCFVALGLVAYIFAVRRAHVFEPISQFLFFFSLFVLPLPIRCLATLTPAGNVSDQLQYFYPFMPGAVALCAVFLILFTVAYYSPLAAWLYRIAPQPVDARQRSPFIAFLVIFGFSLLLVNILAGDRGLLGLILLGYGSSSELFGKGHLAIGFPWAYVSSLFLLYAYALTGKKWYLVAFSLVFGSVSAIHLVMGNRSQIMYFTMAALFLWHFGIRKIRPHMIIMLGVSAFLALNLVGLLRGSDYSDMGAVVDRTTQAFGSIETGSESSGLFYTLTTGEFVVPFEVLPQLMLRASEGGAFEWGATLIKVPVFVIPSVLFPDRPLPLANWYMEEFYGAGFGSNEGRQFFAPAEAYLNFGVAGVLLYAFALGAFWGAIGLYVRHGSKGAILLGSLTIAFIFRSIAGDSVSLLIGLPEQCLSAAVIALWISTFSFGRGR